MEGNRRESQRKSTNPFDSSDDDLASLDDSFHECQEREDLIPKSTITSSAPLDLSFGAIDAENPDPKLVFDETCPAENHTNELFSPLEAAFLREAHDTFSPSSGATNPLSDDSSEEKDCAATQWSRIVRMTSPFVEKMNRVNRGEDSPSIGELDRRPTLARMGSNASFLSAKSEHSNDTGFGFEDSKLMSTRTPKRSTTKKASTKRRSSVKSSVKRNRPAGPNPVLQRLESFPKDSEFTMNYKSPGTPWTHLILLEDLGTASSWAVLIIPYIAFILCLVLESDTELLVHTEGPLRASATCEILNTVEGHTGSVPLIPTPMHSCSFPFSLTEGQGVMSYGGKGYATIQAHYRALMPNGTAFSSGPLTDVPAMSTFLRGDVEFINIPTKLVSLVAKGKVAFSTVVSQRKTDAEWVPVSISKPSRLSMACGYNRRSENGTHPSSWNCSTPRILDVLFSMPGTAILTGADIEVNVLYSYYKGQSFAEIYSIDYFSSNIDDSDPQEVSFVFTGSANANAMLMNATIRKPNDLIRKLVISSSYSIQHQREAYETIDVSVRILCLTVTILFSLFWCWSLGWKGFCGVWGESNQCCCFRWNYWMKRSRREDEDLPLVSRRSDGLLWWESPWLLFPERRYLLFLLLSLLLVQNPLLAYVHFNPRLYSSKNVHTAADTIIGIGVHGLLMLWLCLFCGLRYHTSAITRQRAKQQRALLELRRTAKYIGSGDQSLYGTEDSMLRYTASYYDKFGDVYGSGFVSHLRMKHDPCGDSWADFLLPKVFIFLLGATSVLVTAVCRFPADGDNAATLSPLLLRRYNGMYIFSSFVQLLILIAWVFLIIRNTFLTGLKLRKQPFLSTRPAQLAFRVMSASLFLGVGALTVPVFMDLFKLFKKWYAGKGNSFHAMTNSMNHGVGTSGSVLDIMLHALLHVSERFPYSGTAASIGPGKILFCTTCGLMTAFIFLPSRPFYDDDDSVHKKKNASSASSMYHTSLSEKMQQRRDKRSVVTLARYTHTWRVFPLPIKKETFAADLLTGNSFHIDADFRIRYGDTSRGGIVYIGSYTPVFCVEIACWLLEASWQSYYSPNEFSVNDWAPGRMSLENIGLKLESVIFDESTETQAIVATNIIPQIDGEKDEIIVVAFRGTMNAANLRTDLKVQQVALPDRLQGVDDGASLRIHQGYVEGCEHSGWDEWIGSAATSNVEPALHSFSPRNEEAFDSLDIQWRAHKSSVLSEVSIGTKAVIKATPVARQALPCVHKGFLNAYSRIRKRLWESVLQTLQRQFAGSLKSCAEDNDADMQLRLPKTYVTGHSLGGALGQLFAFDLASNCELVIQVAQSSSDDTQLFSLPGINSSFFQTQRSTSHDDIPGTQTKFEHIACSSGRRRFFSDNNHGQRYDTETRYKSLRVQPPIAVFTFGQPRVGNRAFARLYKKKVPHTFRVVNEGDAFTTMPNTVCGGLYKHAGLEVMLDEGQTGNTLVGPTVVETLFRFTKVRTSVAAHSMERYRNCLESALGQDELQEYFRGHGSKGNSFVSSVEGGNSKALPDWVTKRTKSSPG